VHSVPSAAPEQLLRPELGGLTQWPMPPVAASPMSDEQSPVQQSLLLMQMSFVWMQKDDCRTHVPPGLHSPEQHVVETPPSGGAVQGLPADEHDVLSGVQVIVVAPPSADVLVPHFCPQHSASVVQGWLSATHALAHVPPLHESEQQSSPDPHVAPAPWQFTMDAAQVWLVGSHLFEQQSLSSKQI
jgi:hypothetical protein